MFHDRESHIKEKGNPVVYFPFTAHLIRQENTSMMYHVVLTVVSRANVVSRRHINNGGLVRALELGACAGWVKLRLILIYSTNLAAVFPKL